MAKGILVMRHSAVACNPSQVAPNALSEAENDPLKELENESVSTRLWLYMRVYGLETWTQLVVEETEPKINAMPESTMVNPL
jgi:hypothetical protein